MMTEEAYRERRWRAYPTLRKALEGRSLPSGYYPIMSTYDSLPEALNRLMEIASLICEHGDIIRETAQTEGMIEMHRDLCRITDELMGASSHLRDQASQVQDVCSRLREVR